MASEPRTRLAVDGEPGKACCTCGPRRGPLTLDSFWRHKKSSDGLQDKCKDCCYEYEQARREKRREYRQRNRYKTQTLEKKAEGKQYRPGVKALPGYRGRIEEWLEGGDPYGLAPDAARIRVEHWLLHSDGLREESA